MLFRIPLGHTFFLRGPFALREKTSNLQQEENQARSLGALLKTKSLLIAIITAATAQLAMVMIMTITPHHMHHHHHNLPSISWVLTVHLFGMFGFSFLSGWLADRLGRLNTIGLGGLVLIASCILALLSESFPVLLTALYLLGLGWSFCFLSATAMLVDGLSARERGRVQGFNEAIVSLSSGIGSLSSGLIFDSLGFNNKSHITQ